MQQPEPKPFHHEEKRGHVRAARRAMRLDRYLDFKDCHESRYEYWRLESVDAWSIALKKGIVL